MPITIETRVEGRRGCGYRKPGGLYLMGPPLSHPCCRLPWPLEACPCCGAGFKPARGWTWVEADRLFFPNGPERHSDEPKCHGCPLNDYGIIGRAGLIWIGEGHYKTPRDFLQEGWRMGLSRRITAVPRGFRLGETWVLLAHRRAVPRESQEKDELVPTIKLRPGIFSVFRPVAIEYVVHGDETEEELERLAKRGLTPVRVVNPAKAPIKRKV